MTEPLRKHDCDECLFLGSYDMHDLYDCRVGESTLVTLIARRSSVGEDFTAVTIIREGLLRDGLPLRSYPAHHPLSEAFRRYRARKDAQ